MLKHGVLQHIEVLTFMWVTKSTKNHQARYTFFSVLRRDLLIAIGSASVVSVVTLY